MNAKKLFSHRLALPVAALAIVVAAALAVAMEPQPKGSVTTGLSYQGRLTGDGGEPIDASRALSFGQHHAAGQYKGGRVS